MNVLLGIVCYGSELYFTSSLHKLSRGYTVLVDILPVVCRLGRTTNITASYCYLFSATVSVSFCIFDAFHMHVCVCLVIMHAYITHTHTHCHSHRLLYRHGIQFHY